MSVEGTVLQDYRFDARDFSDSQLQAIEEASCMRKGNKELQQKFNASLRHQLYQRRLYFTKVARARQLAYSKSLLTNLQAKSSVIGAIVEWFQMAQVKLEKLTQRIVPSSWLIDKHDMSDWPDIEVDSDLAKLPHIIASMPEHCVNLTGWERVKQSFLPEIYMEKYDPGNPSHNYNSNIFLLSTAIAGVGAGIAMGYGHASRDLESYKAQEANVLYDNKYWALRARESIFTKTLFRYFFRWGWRVGLIYAISYGISQSMTIYKMEEKVHHYVVGCGVPLALYSWKLGPSGMLKTGLLSAVLVGLPVGILFGSAGLNPRSQLYFTKVEPKVTGSFSDTSRTYEDFILSNNRLLAILDLLKSDYSPELNNKDFYRKFLGVE